MTDLLVFAVPGIPEIARAADLGRVIADAIRSATHPQRSIDPGDVFVVAQKIVSKAEDAVVRLDSVTPSALAIGASFAPPMWTVNDDVEVTFAASWIV